MELFMPLQCWSLSPEHKVGWLEHACSASSRVTNDVLWARTAPHSEFGDRVYVVVSQIGLMVP